MNNEVLFYEVEIDKEFLMEAYKHNMTEFISEYYNTAKDCYERSLLLYGEVKKVIYEVRYGKYLIFEIVYTGVTHSITIGGFVRFTADKIVLPEYDWAHVTLGAAGFKGFTLGNVHVSDFIFPKDSYVLDEFKLSDLTNTDIYAVGDADGITEEDKKIGIGYVREYGLKIAETGELPKLQVRHCKNFMLEYYVRTGVEMLDEFEKWVKPLNVDHSFGVYLRLDEHTIDKDLDKVKQKLYDLLYDKLSKGVGCVFFGAFYKTKSIFDTTFYERISLELSSMNTHFENIKHNLGIEIQREQYNV